MKFFQVRQPAAEKEIRLELFINMIEKAKRQRRRWRGRETWKAERKRVGGKGRNERGIERQRDKCRRWGKEKDVERNERGGRQRREEGRRGG